MTKIEAVHRAILEAETCVLRGETATVISMRDRVRLFADPGSRADIRCTDYPYEEPTNSEESE